jgi:hypothetical protein
MGFLILVWKKEKSSSLTPTGNRKERICSLNAGAFTLAQSPRAHLIVRTLSAE